MVENPDEIIDDYFDTLEEYLEGRKKRTPGKQCDYCDQASRCGQFPLINAEKITNRIREVKISKTNLVKLSNCERRTAWNVQYGLPREDFIEYESESVATKFHQFSQEILVNKGTLNELDYPDALTGGLRRYADNARSIIERTRSDITNAFINESLRKDISNINKDEL